MNLRELFRQHVEKLELCDKGYLEKTMNQLSEVRKREELIRKMQVICKCRDRKKAQIIFNELAGLLNDIQMQQMREVSSDFDV